jgi:hypothetical protein
MASAPLFRCTLLSVDAIVRLEGLERTVELNRTSFVYKDTCTGGDSAHSGLPAAVDVRPSIGMR